MDGFHPRAILAEPTQVGGGSMDPGIPPKLVIHTIEGNPGDRYHFNPLEYYNHRQDWPHATIDSEGIHQHFPLHLSVRALANDQGGAETNHANAIQCEVMCKAEFVGEMLDSTMAHLADWLVWCSGQTGAPLEFASFVAHPAAFGLFAPQRFSDGEWLAFTGVCGHQHVPENDHGDPGDIPLDRLRQHINDQEDEMSPEMTAKIQELLSLSQSTNAALGRVEIAVRDETGGIGRRLEIIEREIAALHV